MRLVVLTLLMAVGAPHDRPKRTIGVIFRGLVDAQTRTTLPPKKDMKTEKIRGPPPATVYIIPVPERDKKNVPVFSSAQAVKVNLTSVQQLTTTDLPPHQTVEKRNATFDEPKQFLIRIAGDDGKSVMIRISGDDVKLKKIKEGYNIGINHQDTKANIKVELPEKQESYKVEGYQQFIIPAKYPSYAEPQKLQSLPQPTLPSYLSYPNYYQQFQQYQQNPHYQSGQQQETFNGYPPATTNPKDEVNFYNPQPTQQVYLQPPKNMEKHQDAKSQLHLTLKLQDEGRQHQNAIPGQRLEIQNTEPTAVATPFNSGFNDPRYPGSYQQYPPYPSQYSQQWQYPQYPPYPPYQNYYQDNFSQPYYGMNSYQRPARSANKTAC